MIMQIYQYVIIRNTVEIFIFNDKYRKIEWKRILFILLIEALVYVLLILCVYSNKFLVNIYILHSNLYYNYIHVYQMLFLILLGRINLLLIETYVILIYNEFLRKQIN